VSFIQVELTHENVKIAENLIEKTYR